MLGVAYSKPHLFVALCGGWLTVSSLSVNA